MHVICLLHNHPLVVAAFGHHLDLCCWDKEQIAHRLCSSLQSGLQVSIVSSSYKCDCHVTVPKIYCNTGQKKVHCLVYWCTEVSGYNFNHLSWMSHRPWVNWKYRSYLPHLNACTESLQCSSLLNPLAEHLCFLTAFWFSRVLLQLWTLIV